jgi:hypothetical protein
MTIVTGEQRRQPVTLGPVGCGVFPPSIRLACGRLPGRLRGTAVACA